MSATPNDGDDLRRTLHDAVSDVQPHGTLDDIRSRTDKVVPMKRWFLPTLAVAAVMAAVVGGAVWLVGDHDKGSGPSGTPTHASQSPSTGGPSQSTSPGGDVTTRAVPVYYVGQTAHGRKLFREFHQQEVSNLQDALGLAAVRAALTGDPNDPDYANPWPAGAADNLSFAYDPDSGELTISLPATVHDRPAGMSQADAGLAVQQLIYSAQAGLGRGRVPVQLLIDDKHTDTVLGVPAAEPLAADNPDDVLAPVQIDDPANGATVSSTLVVTGRAATFEANVVWEVKQGATVVKHGFTTAQECCTLSPFSFTVEGLAPGDYTVVAHDTDESGQGRPVNQDTKDFTVQ